MRCRLLLFSEKSNQERWHRLAKVSILVISGMGILFSCRMAWESAEGQVTKHIYNFEQGYSSNPHPPIEVTMNNVTADFLDRTLEASKHQDWENIELPVRRTASDYYREEKESGKDDSQIVDELLSASQKHKIAGDKNMTLYMKIWKEYDFFTAIVWLTVGPLLFLFLTGLYRFAGGSNL